MDHVVGVHDLVPQEGFHARPLARLGLGRFERRASAIGGGHVAQGGVVVDHHEAGTAHSEQGTGDLEDPAQRGLELVVLQVLGSKGCEGLTEGRIVEGHDRFLPADGLVRPGTRRGMARHAVELDAHGVEYAQDAIVDRPGPRHGDAATSCVQDRRDLGDGRQGSDADEVHIVEIEGEAVHVHGIDGPEEPVELLDGVQVEVTREDHEGHGRDHVQFHQKRRLVGAGQAWLVHDDDDLRDGS